MASVTLNQSVGAIKTLALFNISLTLELSIPSENTTTNSLEYATSAINILDKHLEWEDVKKLAYPNISVSWLNGIDGWYIPLMSRGAGEQMYRFFLGKDKSINETTDKEWRKMCATEEWIEPIALIRGFGESQIVKYYFDHQSIGAWNSTYWSDKNDQIEKGSVVLTYADNNSYVVEVRVWEDQRKDWMVYSTKTKINKNEMESVIKHVISLGFDPMDVISVSYDNCRPAV